MRILMISDVYFPRVNGVSTSIETFRNALVEQGHTVTLVAPEYPGAGESDDNVIRIPARRVPLDAEDRMMRIGALRRAEKELAQQSFDIIHIQTPFFAHYAGVRLARRLGIPAVATYHTFFEEYLYHYVPFLPKLAMRFLARRFSRSQCDALDGLVVPSRPMLEKLRSYGISTAAAVIPTGIPADRFGRCDGAAFRRRHGIEPDRPVAVFVGRAAHEKNIHFLLSAIAEVRRREPRVLLVVAGEGPALEHLKHRARVLGLANNVRFIGYLSRKQDLQDCYCAGDAFVFASRTETQGLVLLEAMALGVPVVSTAVMGTRDILAAGQGALVAEEDVADFAGKLRAVLGDSALRARLAEQARAHAALWAPPVLAGQLIEYYGSVTNRARALSPADA